MDRSAKVLLALVIGFFLASAARAHAGTLQVEILGGKTQAEKRVWWKSRLEEPARKWSGRSLGEVTVRVLDEMKREAAIDFEASEQGVRRIGNLGSDLEVISDTRMKAYGWCVRLERGNLWELPEVMPESLTLTDDISAVVWFYGYAEYDAKKGGWINQCVPSQL
jgi:hypothetical protein